MGNAVGRPRRRSLAIHTDEFGPHEEEGAAAVHDANTNRYRQRSIKYTKRHNDKPSERRSAPPDIVVPFESSPSSNCSDVTPPLAPLPDPLIPPLEAKGERPPVHVFQPGNNLVALKYSQRMPTEKMLTKAGSVKSLSTHAKNPMKYRRQSICPDLTANLSMAFTVDVLADPVTLQLMIKFAADVPYAAERLHFWADAQHLRSLPSAQYTDKVLRKIYEKFLSATAPTPICVPTAMLKAIRAAFESPTGIQSAGTSIYPPHISPQRGALVGIYSEAQALCLRDLEKDVFPRFRKHQLYADMCQELAEKPSKWKVALGGVLQSSHLLYALSIFVQRFDMLLSSSAHENHDAFLGVMNNETKLRYFKSYCVENLTLENLMFHMDVEEAKRLPNQSFIQARARKIIDTYFRPSSKMYIHLSPAIHDSMLENYHAGAFEPAMFVDAQFVAMEFIRDQVWPKFSASPIYVKHIQASSVAESELEAYVPNITTQDVELLLADLDSMSSAILLQKAMELPVHLMANIARAHQVHHDTALLLLQDKIAHRIFKKFLRMRGKEHYVAFVDDVEEYTSLPGIEFMQHTAKKLFKKYLSDTAKLQVDMSTKMRQDIESKLDVPSIDMFKPAIFKVKTGLLQDSLMRYLMSPIHTELHEDPDIPHLVREVTAARDCGKLDLPHLESVLSHPKYVGNFRKFLATQHATENLIFLEEVEEFRRLPSSQIVLRNAKKIVDKYINKETAKSPLPLNDRLHDTIIAQSDGTEKTFFNGAVHEIMHLLRTEEVPEFLDAPIFMILVGAWAILDETYARKQLVGDLELAYFRHRFHAICESKRHRRNAHDS
ncbi:unnamed protein product [Aphanomyces euteiches]